LCGQFAGDRGKKGLLRVGEEKRKEKEARVERKRVEDKRKQEE
jgi:hypothetical protein